LPNWQIPRGTCAGRISVSVYAMYTTPSKATQENFEAIVADLRTCALEVKKEDEGLRKRELKVKERKQQQQVLKRSQRVPSVTPCSFNGNSKTAALRSQNPIKKLAGKRVSNNGKGLPAIDGSYGA
jgi:hypothetical protein